MEHLYRPFNATLFGFVHQGVACGGRCLRGFCLLGLTCLRSESLVKPPHQKSCIS
ncbi:hypothetical protein YC2023_051919 [Brassica napus]